MDEPRIISLSLVNTSCLEVEACHHDGRHQYSYHDLDTYLGISDGSFSIGGTNFSKGSRRIRLNGARLIAEVPAADDHDQWVEATVGLDVHLPSCDTPVNDDGKSDVAKTYSNVVKITAAPSDSTIYGWSLWCTSVSAFLIYRSPEGRKHVDLDGKIGNHNGKFSTRARRFARSARNVSLAGSILTGELQAPEKTWSLDHINVGKFMTLPVTSTDYGEQEESIAADLPAMCNDTLYQPLDRKSIRLCQIVPGEWDEPIACTIIVRDSTSSKLPYCCLSYVWGDTAPASMIAISVNGHERLVTKSLYQALRRLRWHRKADLLWVDALCINQDDLAEKSVQVARMRDTYISASSVLIWLGEDESFSTLRNESGNLQTGSLSFLLYDLYHNLALDMHPKTIPGLFDEALGRGPLYPIIEQTLEILGEAEWFHRQWTVQEVTVAREAEVYCGSFEMDFADFSNFLLYHFWCKMMDTDMPPIEYTSDGKSLFHSFIPGTHRLMNLDYLRKAFLQFKTSPPEKRWQPALVMLCESHGYRKMADPRDAVFACLPLTPLGFGHTEYRPDYTHDVEKVYQDFTFRIMEDARNYEVWDLIFYDDTDKPRLSLSSWAINWYAVGMQGKRIQELQSHPVYNAYSKIKASPKLIEDENLLVVEAYIFDEISSVSPFTWGDVDYTTDRGLREWLDIAGPDTLWKITTAEHTEITEGKYRRAESQDKESWLRWSSSILEDSWEAWDKERSMSDNVYNITYRRNLIQSINGYIGLGWPLIQVGDVLCLIKGARFPYTLRRCDKKTSNDGKQLYELVGPCTYLLGLEEKEGMDWVDKTVDVYLC